MGKVVNLSWSSHASDLTTGIWEFLQDKYKIDFEVSINGNYISAHQLIMAVFCPAIKTCQNTTLILGENPITVKKDMETVVEFMYRGKVKVEETRLLSIMKLADQLGFKVLADLIAESLEVRKTSTNAPKTNLPKKEFDKYQSKLRILPDRMKKKRSSPRYSSKVTEFIKLPSKTVATLKGLNSNLSLSPKKDEDHHIKIVNVKSLDTEVDLETSPKPFKRAPRRRDDLCLESFDPQTFEFICKQCGKGFAKANDLYNHLRVHEEAKIRYECQHCDYKTNNRTCFSGHMINKHQMDIQGNLRPKDLKCPQCSYMCSVNFQLKNHIYLVHSAKRKVCESCNYRCQSKATLEKHKRLVHSNAKPLMCETCGFRAKIFADLYRHMRVHFCSKVACDICGASVSANHLSVHKKIHSTSPKPFVCHLCSFTSWKNWNLKVHLKSVHEKDGEK